MSWHESDMTFLSISAQGSKENPPRGLPWRKNNSDWRLEKHDGQFGHFDFLGWKTLVVMLYPISRLVEVRIHWEEKGRIIKNLIYLECLTWSSPLRQVDCFRSLGSGYRPCFPFLTPASAFSDVSHWPCSTVYKILLNWRASHSVN